MPGRSGDHKLHAAVVTSASQQQGCRTALDLTVGCVHCAIAARVDRIVAVVVAGVPEPAEVAAGEKPVPDLPAAHPLGDVPSSVDAYALADVPVLLPPHHLDVEVAGIWADRVQPLHRFGERVAECRGAETEADRRILLVDACRNRLCLPDEGVLQKRLHVERRRVDALGELLVYERPRNPGEVRNLAPPGGVQLVDRAVALLEPEEEVHVFGRGIPLRRLHKRRRHVCPGRRVQPRCAVEFLDRTIDLLEAVGEFRELRRRKPV